MVKHRAVRAGAIALAVALSIVAAPAAQADDSKASQGLRKALTVDGVREHQVAFQTHRI